MIDVSMEGVVVRVVHGDIPQYFLRRLEEQGSPRVAIDIETSGLNFREDSIGSIQVYDGIGEVVIVRPPFAPTILGEIVSNERITKILHHAMFDLRFLAHQMKMKPKNIRCTKIAAKIVLRDIQKSSLADIVQHYLGKRLDKGQRMSNWMLDALSSDQVLYAIRDVIYLPNILAQLLQDSDARRLRPLLIKSFEYIPTRVELDLLGAGDVFTY